MPKLRFPGWPGGNGLNATLSSVGGTGTPAASYTITAIGTRVYEITVADTLVGAFELLADTGAIAAFAVELTGSDVDVSVVGNVPTPTENATAAAAAILATPGNKLATAADGKVTAELTSDYDAAKTAATQASVSALPDATANGTAAAAAIERADGMLKKVPKIGDQVRRINQLNKHVDETLAEVPE